MRSVTKSILAAAVALALAAVACGSSEPSSPVASSSVSTTAPQTVATPPTIAVIPPDTVEAPPPVDLSTHSVPLDEVFFDTFDGGAVRLSDSTPELRSRLLDAIPPIDQPVYEEAVGGAWLDDTDLVVGYVADGQAYAYPFKILNFHEIVNDTIDGVPVLISYCPLCRSAVVYDRTVDGVQVSFGNTSALYESDMVMVDRTTGSYWWQVAGRAIVGPLTGAELVALPSEVDTWAGWLGKYPDTLVLSRDTGHERPYSRDSFLSYAERLETNDPPFSFGTTSKDVRLSPGALVAGVVLDDVVRVYPVDGLDAPINDVVGSTPVVVLPNERGAAVFFATVGDSTLTISATSDGLVDDQTGSTWLPSGVATEGRLEGTELERVPVRTTFWFAFIGAFPDAEIFVASDA